MNRQRLVASVGRSMVPAYTCAKTQLHCVATEYTPMTDLTTIVTSRSAVKTYQGCNRKRWHMYESPNGTATPGWERRAMSIPLSTGIYTHKGIEVLLRQVIAGSPCDVEAAVKHACGEYRGEVEQRGIAVEADSQAEDVIDE